MSPKNFRPGHVPRSSYAPQSARAVRASKAAQSGRIASKGQTVMFSQGSYDDSYNGHDPYEPQGAPAPGGYRPAYTPGKPGGGAGQFSRNNPAYAARKSSRTKKIVIGVLIAVLVVAVGAATAFGMYISRIDQQLKPINLSDEDLKLINDELKKPASFKEPFYMLLIGSDRREGDDEMGQRSDTNIVARIDPVNCVVTMVSIPRDTKIEIDGYGDQKFNAAYNFGGALATIKEVKQLLGIEISYYAEVNFQELVQLVDAVDGVDIYVEELIDDPDADGTSANPDWPRRIFEVGDHHMYGDDALCYARSRAFVDGDFTRTMHQRTLIMAIVEKVLAMPVVDLPPVIEAAASCVSTNMNVKEIIDLALQLKQGPDLVVYSAMLPSWTGMENGISYVYNDEEKTKEMMELVEKGEDPSEIVSDGPPAGFQPSGSFDWNATGGDEVAYTGGWNPYSDPQPQDSGTGGETGGDVGTVDPGPSGNGGGNEGGNGGGTGGGNGGGTTVVEPPATDPGTVDPGTPSDTPDTPSGDAGPGDPGTNGVDPGGTVTEGDASQAQVPAETTAQQQVA